MPVPSRPVTLTSVASVWGQWLHDFTFAPAGCIASGSAALAMLSAGAYRKLNLDVADEDPGGYVVGASDQIEVPTNGGGLYQCLVQGFTDNGEADEQTNVQLQINGSTVAAAQVVQDGGTSVIWNISWGGLLAAGDIVSLRARQIGSGDRADVQMSNLMLVRIGDEMGAPTA